MNAKWCNRAVDIPLGDHYAIIEFSYVHIPGDERSKAYPGHGYPSTTESVQRYVAYTDRAAWEQEVTSRALKGRNDFVALVVSRPEIKVETSIQLINNSKR